jgi:hypothetical protein
MTSTHGGNSTNAAPRFVRVVNHDSCKEFDHGGTPIVRGTPFVGGTRFVDVTEMPSINLTPARGPSVWTRDREHTIDRRWLAMIVGGAVLASSALRRPSSGRVWAATLGLACVAAGLLCQGCSRRLSAALERIKRSWDSGAGSVNDAVDQASADSFPASDAPSSSVPASALRR